MCEPPTPHPHRPAGDATCGTATAAVAAHAAATPSPAELKKRAKAEKQARRAAEKESRGLAAGAAPAANGPGRPLQSQPKAPPKHAGPERKSSGQLPVQLPVRARRASQTASKEQPKKPEPKPDSKNVELFSHLYSQPRRTNLEGASKDVHPSVVALGFQMASYEICGSSARCVGMLHAFKHAIAGYTTPTGTSLARHMTAHHLSPQIDFLKSCRPISESMGNAIRWLKKLIAEIDPSTPDHEAIEFLCGSIDQFIRERITATDQAIATSACPLIKNGSVVLTYAKSAIVEKTIVTAHAQGKQFRVVCVDSRPLGEGKKLARSLMHAGLPVEYLPFSGLNRAVADATVVLLGAHSMLSNGRLQSRIGTAAVAMAAHRADVPVIVCCESVKFSGKVALDSIVLNEVAPPEELLFPPPPPPPPPPAAPSATDEHDTDQPPPKTLNHYPDIPNLHILNLMYDVTPAEYIRVVICEYGSVPPSSVPVVHRLANEGE